MPALIYAKSSLSLSLAASEWEMLVSMDAEHSIKSSIFTHLLPNIDSEDWEWEQFLYPKNLEEKVGWTVINFQTVWVRPFTLGR